MDEFSSFLIFEIFEIFKCGVSLRGALYLVFQKVLLLHNILYRHGEIFGNTWSNVFDITFKLFFKSVFIGGQQLSYEIDLNILSQKLQDLFQCCHQFFLSLKQDAWKNVYLHKIDYFYIKYIYYNLINNSKTVIFRKNVS